MKKILLVTTLFTLAMNTLHAQEYVDRNFKITKNIAGVMLNGGQYPVDEKNHKATLEIVNFGDQGNTAILTIDLPSVREADPSVDNMEYAWSGKNLHVVKKKENGGDVYAIMRISRNPIMCGSLIEVKKNDGTSVWVALISPQNDNTRCISDIHAGMTRLAVESKCKELGLSQFKFVRNDGNMKVYELQWLDMQKKQHWFGREDYHYEVTNDKTYGSFWFDANDKLVKWLMP